MTPGSAYNFDAGKVPDIVAVDTSFLISAYDKPAEDKGMSEALLKWMLSKGKYVLIPATVFAEFEVQGATKIPRSAQMRVVAFDEDAANRFAAIGNQNLRNVHNSSGEPRAVVRNDAVIAATALRHGAQMLIAGDGRPDIVAICASLGLKLARPDALVEQMSLFIGTKSKAPVPMVPTEEPPTK